MRSQIGKLSTAFTLLVAAHCAQAQSIRPTYQYPPVPPESGAASVQMPGTPLYFAPYVAVAAGRDDNVLNSRDNHRASSVYIFGPGLSIDARGSKSVFQLTYAGQFARYASSRDDDYTDHTLRAQYDVAFDRRNFLRLDAEYLRGHDARGLTDRPITNELDKYRFTTPGIMYAFGAPGAAGRVEAYYSDQRKRYQSNRAFTAAADRDRKELGGALYLRVAPRTYAMVEARETRIEYVQASPFDAKERRYYGGVSWDVTEKTKGTVKVGRFQRNFDSNLPDYSGVGWEAAITWSPRSYSKFDFYTSRFSTEQSGLGNFILSDASGVTWSHSWTSYITTAVDIKYQKDSYQGFNRKDDTMALGLKVGYKFRRWLTLGGEYTYTKRDSTFDPAEYDKNLYFLTATASM